MVVAGGGVVVGFQRADRHHVAAVGSDHAGGHVQLVGAVPAAEPALLDRDGLGVEPLGDAESLRVAVGTCRRRLREIAHDDVGLFGRQPAAAVQQHVVVADQIACGARRDVPVSVVGRSRARQPVPRHDAGDDGVSAAAVPEVLGRAVVGGPQHDVEGLAVGRRERRLALGLLQQQVVGDEQLHHRGDRER